MDGLFLLFIVPLAYLVLLLIILAKSSSQNEKLNAMSHTLDELRQQLRSIGAEIKALANNETQKTVTLPVETKKPIIPEKPVIPIVLDVVIDKPKPDLHELPPVKPLEKKQVPIPVADDDEVNRPKEPAAPTMSMKGLAPAKKTDWEKFIGENLANKIGIAVLVLGISFFVKLAIDNDWINETWRVVIGFTCGAILVALAHYTRRTYRSFSSVLVGGGLAVFYFVTAYSFHAYQLLDQRSAFIVMVAITIFAVLLSLLYDRLELAMLATIGGFVTPFLASTGQNNYIALFTYLSILNVGVLCLSWFKRWKPVNVAALFFTVIIFGGWLIDQFMSDTAFLFRPALFFASLFYALFVSMNIINNIRLRIRFGGFDIVILLVINFLFYVAGIAILDAWDNGAFTGLFTAALGIINLSLAWLLFRQQRADRNLIYLLIGLTLTFISLAAPVQLKGNHITIFWAAEAVVLFWLFQRSRIVLLKVSSLLILFLMSISLLMDWSMLYSYPDTIIPAIANKGFITTIIAGLALLIYHRLLFREADSAYLPGISRGRIRSVMIFGGSALLFTAGALEIYYQFSTRIPGTRIHILYLQVYTAAFSILLLSLFRRSAKFPLVKLVLTFAVFVLFLITIGATSDISRDMLLNDTYKFHFLAHGLFILLLGWLIYDLVIYFFKSPEFIKSFKTQFTWSVAVASVFFISVELFYPLIWSSYNRQEDFGYWQNLYNKAGLSIIWGLSSFAMMWLGMKYKFKTLRIISLTLFTVTIAKLFFIDIRNIPAAGKIAVFTLLGVLLLIVSFMYQRLKKIIIDDREKN